MIAPLRPSEAETIRSHRRLRHLHILLAAAFLPGRRSSGFPMSQVAAWKAWLFTGWVTLAVTVYAASMLGIW
jgi:hypothetical protein